MKYIFALLIVSCVAYAARNDAGVPKRYESERLEEGCLTEEQDCTMYKDGCCSGSGGEEVACLCYTSKYLEGKSGPEVNRCWCEKPGHWWKFVE